MQRRHFKLIAEVLNAQRPADRGPASTAWVNIVSEFGRRLRDTNDAFNYSRFIEACNEGHREE
jgi:hypothetical protein